MSGFKKIVSGLRPNFTKKDAKTPVLQAVDTGLPSPQDPPPAYRQFSSTDALVDHIDNVLVSQQGEEQSRDARRVLHDLTRQDSPENLEANWEDDAGYRLSWAASSSHVKWVRWEDMEMPISRLPRPPGRPPTPIPMQARLPPLVPERQQSPALPARASTSIPAPIPKRKALASSNSPGASHQTSNSNALTGIESGLIKHLDWSLLTDEEAYKRARSFDSSKSPTVTPTSPTANDSAMSLDSPEILPPRTYQGKGKARITNDEEARAYAKQTAANLSVRERFIRLRQFNHDTRRARELQDEYDLEAHAYTERDRPKECIVCGEPQPAFSFPPQKPTTACTHAPNTCTTCSQSWITAEFETKGSDGIKCPECPSLLTYEDIKRLASPETFTSYDRIAARNFFTTIPGFAWCLAPGCEHGQVNEENYSFMECKACHYAQCTAHHIPWHFGETCHQYDERVSRKDEEEELDKVSKRCPGPGCGWRIEKASGCDHMTCKKCRYEFCWMCMASQKRIRREGNTAHEKECPYHSDKLAIAWPFNAH